MDKSAPDGLAYFIDMKPEVEDFRAAVLSGFSSSPKTLPPKFFYDDRGSHLFNAICETPEYYVTRTEIALLRHIGPELSGHAGPTASVIEYGCGSAEKIRSLLSALENPVEYVAIDISRAHLIATASDIARDYSSVRVGAICADFTGELALPDRTGEGAQRRIAFFPGSTIGNQTPEEAVEFLKRIRRVVGDGGGLIIGVDLKKDTDILNRAYNDADGYTADFNLNLLHRMKKELNAAVNPDQFEHLAFYNEDKGRIEMHLTSKIDQTVGIAGESFSFRKGETIHTENSYKYDISEFAAIAAKAGFFVETTWADPDDLFSIHFMAASR